VPNAPFAPMLESSSETSITISWNALATIDDGGSSITGYRVYMNDIITDNWILVYDGSNYPSILVYLQTGLTEGSTYRFEVTALNAVGESAPSPSASFIAASYPSAPGQPQLVTSNSTSIEITWNPPSDNGGSMISGYEIFFKLAN
jgi:hypothetical protein